ncbi:bacteriohemerythrin [Denitratisoma oestradiolicum]|uniref:Hemerythrin-like domain-containing protein n=1 Tax=Denitratisoma oestradiolicum TaxID=311182 RepID=A0A6S6YK75_9PROT|nr:bacteriohemerythrin [Denitratisoma oestradiolicum]TWO79443.1 hypothetical protein CBW56_14995 [Denitratisoma oestradiolicum]CAB1368154.1 conserved protein of unknown function [Denitratisoma oestradiolicum]
MDDRPQFISEFLVGIPLIDQEHRQLVDIAGDIYDSLGSNEVTAQAAARSAAARLLAYTVTHFASEEALMEAAGYPELEAHRQLHQQLLHQANDMAMRAELGDQYVPGDLSHFIYVWLVKHIQAQDKRFGEFMAARKD